MKRMLTALLLMAMAGGAFAQGKIYNPSNTPTTGGINSWPFRIYTDWRFSFIVNASVLPGAPVKITDIAFAPTSTTTWSAKQFQMRMNHTTLSTYAATTPPRFDTVLGSCPTIVYDGPLRWSCTANAWSPIGLTCDYGYDGKRNICVELRYQGGPGSAGVTTRTDGSINRAYTHNSYSADPYNEPLWRVPIPGEALGPKHCLDYSKTNILIADDTVSLGNGAAINVINATNPGDQIQIAASLGQKPLISQPGCRICLDADGVFFASVLGFAPNIFGNYRGIVGPRGTYTGKFVPPALRQLVGLCVFHAALIYNRNGIQGCTNTDGTLITP